MSATRTQVYLTEDQRHRIDSAASAQGVTMAELIRRAVDRYLEDDPDPSRVLAHTFAADPNASAPSRDGWRRG